MTLEPSRPSQPDATSYEGVRSAVYAKCNWRHRLFSREKINRVYDLAIETTPTFPVVSHYWWQEEIKRKYSERYGNPLIAWVIAAVVEIVIKAIIDWLTERNSVSEPSEEGRRVMMLKNFRAVVVSKRQNEHH